MTGDIHVVTCRRQQRLAVASGDGDGDGGGGGEELLEIGRAHV